jgi:hypothetical protein
MKNEVVMVRSQRNQYDHAIRSAGVHIVEAGLPDRVAGAGVRDAEPWEIAAAVTERTVAIVYVANASARPTIEEVAHMANSKHVPLLVDAAAQLPPIGGAHCDTLKRDQEKTRLRGGTNQRRRHGDSVPSRPCHGDVSIDGPSQKREMFPVEWLRAPSMSGLRGRDSGFSVPTESISGDAVARIRGIGFSRFIVVGDRRALGGGFVLWQSSRIRGAEPNQRPGSERSCAQTCRPGPLKLPQPPEQRSYDRGAVSAIPASLLSCEALSAADRRAREQIPEA